MGHLAVTVKQHHMSKSDALVYFHAAVASVSADLDHLGAEWQMGQVKELLADLAECFPAKEGKENGQDEL